MRPGNLLGGQVCSSNAFTLLTGNSLSLIFTLLLLVISGGIYSQSTVIWSDYIGASGVCPPAGSITFDGLSQNPVSGDCVEVTITSETPASCESVVLRSLNGGISDVLNHAMSGNINTCKEITFTFSSPVTNLIIPILDIDQTDEITSSIAWTNINNLSSVVSGNTITGSYDCGSGGGSCNVILEYAGPISTITFDLCYGSTGVASNLVEVSFDALEFDVVPADAGSVEINGSPAGVSVTVDPCSDYLVEAIGSNTPYHYILEVDAFGIVTGVHTGTTASITPGDCGDISYIYSCL